MILEHVLPSRPDIDIAHRKIFADPRIQGTVKDDFKPETQTIYLSPNEHSSDLLGKVIAHVAALFAPKEDYLESDPRVQAATAALLAMGENSQTSQTNKDLHRRDAVHHPLFAALMGQTLALNPNDDPTKLKRGDLIEQYFKPAKRIPWREAKEDEQDQNAISKTIGSWIGVYISAATLLRGIEFDHLKKFLPQKIENVKNRTGAISDIKQVSLRLVSREGDKNQYLMPLEPDILGENFFLIFLERFIDDEELICLCRTLSDFKDAEQEHRAVNGFLETIQRLVRNLINDDQETPFVKDAWESLSAFLKSEHFNENSFLQDAITIALGDIVGQMSRSGFDAENIQGFADGVNISSFQKLSETVFWLHNVLSAFEYLDWMLQTAPEEAKKHGQLLEAIHQSLSQSDKALTALYIASLNGHHYVVKYLLEHGADVNQATTDDGTTALMAASLNGHTEVAQRLIQNGADVNKGTSDIGITSLILASQEGHIDLVKLLLANNANVNQSATDIGGTALMSASLFGHEEIVRILIDCGADINRTTDQQGSNPLLLASSFGHQEIAVDLLRHGSFIFQLNLEPYQATVNNGGFALFHASQDGYLNIVRLLIENGAKVNTITNRNGFTALMLASQQGQTELVKYLLESGANVNQSTKDIGFTALILSCQNGHLESTKLLVEHNAEVNHQSTDNGFNALMVACQNGYIDIVQFLFDHGANLNLTTTDTGFDAQMIAEFYQQNDIVELINKLNS